VTLTAEGALAVVKVGGSLAGIDGALARAGAALGRAAEHRPLLIVPGGGPFADAVRAFDARHGLSDDQAHWMAMLGMDQFAHALAGAVPRGRVIEMPAEVRPVLVAGDVPVLAPSRWLRAADVLPHSWNATSDSAAAFVAGALDARLLVLVKAVAGAVETLVDPWFEAVVPQGLRVEVVGVSELARLDAVLAG
jgi:5-(aminomethyl)-3-furanmethanol phosphate kinase